jgi:LacI family transcriptional regulator
MGKTVAVVMSEVFMRRLTPSLVPLVRSGLDFRILSIHRSPKTLLQLLRKLQPQGLITEWLPDITESLLELKIPTVIADTDFVYPGVVSIDVDDRAVGREAAERFMLAGFRSFACLGNELPYSKQRIHGFNHAIGKASAISTYHYRGGKGTRYSEYFDSADSHLRQWLHALPKPVGLFAAHDPLGRFVCDVCREEAIAVPDEIAVIGANDDPLVCELSWPPLASVIIPWEHIGIQIVDAMQTLLRGGKAPTTVQLIAPGTVAIRQSAQSSAVGDTLAQRVMSYFEAHVGEPINVATACDSLNVGRRQVERAFQLWFKATPHQMLCRLRVNKARQLLLTSKLSIAQIAERSGFGNPEQMAVVFKRQTGKTPSAFRGKFH